MRSKIVGLVALSSVTILFLTAIGTLDSLTATVWHDSQHLDFQNKTSRNMSQVEPMGTPGSGGGQPPLLRFCGESSGLKTYSSDYLL